MSRYRTRREFTTVALYNDAPWWTAVGYAETMYESSVPGSCSVYHVKQDKLINGSIGTTGVGNGKREWRNLAGYIPTIPHPSRLDWGKIPSSSEFGIIQFFAELDDTIAMFTRRFWQQLNYGSFTWGVLPFVNDVKALLKTISNLSKRLDSFDYEDSYSETFVIDSPAGGGRWKGSMDVKYHLTGKADIGFQDPASIFLDRLGFHPDLATAWDLVPLSFVLDWILPVGDFLESLRGGGWVKVANFSGWTTAKARINASYVQDPSIEAGSLPYSATVFQRSPSSIILTVPTTIDYPTLELPSLREMFNMVYILGLRNGKK